MDEATGAASLILFLALLAIEIVMYGFGRAIQSLNGGKIHEMAEAGNKKAEQIEQIMDQPVDYINTIQTFTILIHLVMGGFFLAVFKRLFVKIPGMGGISGGLCAFADLICGRGACSEKDRNKISEAVGICLYQTHQSSACGLETGDKAV